jgi:uncharacterized protein
MELSFKIKEIPATGAPLRVKREIPRALLSEVFEGSDGDVSRSSASVEVELTRDHDEVYGRGRVRGVFELACSRCLEPARVPIDARIDLLFHRQGVEPEPAGDDDEVEVNPDEPDAFTHDGTTLSLVEPLRELLIAELPISALCDEDCRGLCASCGANQNTEEGRACGHAQHEVEDEVDEPKPGPFAGLADIKLPS